MRRNLQLVGVLAILAASFGCTAGSVAFKEARKAELRKDWDTALVNYQKAIQSEPENAKYLIHEKLVRGQASYFHLRQGRRLLEQGRKDEAAGEFQKSVSIDPTNEAAGQELAKLLAEQAIAKKARETALKEALKSSEEASGASTVKLKPFPNELIGSIRLTTDSRKAYESLAKLAGINVAFTVDFQPRPVQLDLSKFKVEDALKLLALETKSFWRPVNENTILVVPDTPNNRRDYDLEVVKTIYLSNPLAAADRTAITTALKQVLGLQRIIDNPDSNAIIIRDNPEKVAAAEQLIRDLDRGKAEILVDVSIIEANRDRIRDLGISPATITPSGQTPGLQSALVFTPPGISTTAGGTTTITPGSSINFGGTLSTHDYSLVLPSALASALLNDTRTHILQNPQVRVTDGQKATLKIGQRIPYATGSFLPSLGVAGTTGAAGGGFGLLASTQFQFQDVGVNMEITPHLLSDGEIALHAKIEILSLGNFIPIGGLSEPSFGQRQIEHDIRLKEGEVNLLGGLIQTTETRSVSGTPILGDIPLLRYLFSTEHRERQETEVLVMLTPRVVRLPEPPLAASSNQAVSGGGAGTGSQAGPPAISPETPQPPQTPGQPQ